ncbi:unnamed protein product [Blepharisma stoltei]|uniref:Uncharacterized protein n=1 Tax=Blepharisma stoltei TaxID=1481888 RepID=A0AAU9ILF5_9CILI|nr:unnamed protein product [Blepharisma stoltei]
MAFNAGIEDKNVTSPVRRNSGWVFRSMEIKDQDVNENSKVTEDSESLPTLHMRKSSKLSSDIFSEKINLDTPCHTFQDLDMILEGKTKHFVFEEHQKREELREKHEPLKRSVFSTKSGRGHIRSIHDSEFDSQNTCKVCILQ